MREAIASPNREFEVRPAKVGPKIVPIDQDADVMQQFEVEPKGAEGAGILQSEQEEEKEKEKKEE